MLIFNIFIVEQQKNIILHLSFKSVFTPAAKP